jgi:RecB family exonuclease
MLSTYKECPLKYKYAYIDKLKKKDTPQRSMGESIHIAMSRFFKLKEKNQRTIQKLHELLRKSWIRKGFSDIEEERQWGLLALDMLTKFYNTFDPYINPVMIEEYFEVDIDDNIKITGKIDRVDKLPTGEYELIDYKTGKSVITQEEADNDLQLTIYYFAMVKGYNIEPKRLTYIFLQANDKVSTVRTKEQLEEVLFEIKKLVKQIEATQRFEPNPNKFCTSCDFNQICPAYIQKESILEATLPF